ncbi:MAG: hypothetical protein ACK4TA_25780 [Saprospiraceae bacterium]
MKLDQEMDVLSRCYEVLSKADDDVKSRVLLWLSSKFGVGQATVVFGAAASNGASAGSENGTTAHTTEKPAETGPAGLESFTNFTDMYRALRPNSDAEKALTAAVYLSAKRNMSEVSSAQVQKELKLIGERVSNITQAISALVKKKYIMQLGKEGDSQQARKKYKITPEAVRVIGEMLKKHA